MPLQEKQSPDLLERFPLEFQKLTALSKQHGMLPNTGFRGSKGSDAKATGNS